MRRRSAIRPVDMLAVAPNPVLPPPPELPAHPEVRDLIPPSPAPSAATETRVSVAASPWAGRPITNVYWACTALVVVERDGAGAVKRTTVPAEYVSFIRGEDATKPVLDALRSSRFVLGICDEPGGWVRIRWLSRDAAKRAAAPGGWFDRAKIRVYEADVDPVRRFLTESGVEIAKPRRVYLDFEADNRVRFSEMARMRILAWSLVAEDGSYERAEVLAEESDAAERAMLVELWKALGAYDQVVSWNGDRFDFVLLGLRTERLGIAVEPRRLLWLDHMRVYERMNVSASESGDEKQSLALQAVATTLLGAEEGEKLVHLGELGGPTSYGMWSAGGEQRERLREYCLDDSRKMRRIEEKTGYLALLQSIAEVTHTLPDSRCVNPTRYVEGYLMRLGRERQMKFATWNPPEKRDESEEGGEAGEKHDQFKGAFVIGPTKKGLMRDVHVADFSRLYPSIIISWNISPETWRPDVVLVESAMGRPSYLAHLPLRRFPLPEGHCAAPLTERAFVNEPQGVLALAVAEMLRLRAFWDDKKKSAPPGTAEWKEADRRSSAYKIAANAFFGVVGSPWSRFFVREVAEAISQAGSWLIQETIRAAEERGWRVVYGDTDSLFVFGCTEGEFSSFVEWCNAELYPRLLREKGCARAMVKLAYEKAFKILVLVRSKGYAGSYSHFKGKRATADSKPEIKGLEYKRGDSVRLARRMQQEVIELLLQGHDKADVFEQLVERWRRRVLDEALELDDVQMSKRLSKPIREYKQEKKKDGTLSARPPHVEVAAMLKERGQDVSSGVRIPFFIVDGSGSPAKYAPAEDWKGEVDRFAIWEDYVYPPTLRVLEACFPAVQWSRWARVRPAKIRGALKVGEQTLFGSASSGVMKQRALEVPAEEKRRRAPAKKRSDVGGQHLLAFVKGSPVDAPHDGGDGGASDAATEWSGEEHEP